MIEHAKRQVFLVLLSLIAGLFCIVAVEPVWGNDLKGGIQLLYEIPEEAIARLEVPGSSRDQIMEQTVGIITERADPDGTLGATVTRSGPLNILIELPWMQPTTRDEVLARIASLGRLEMRMVADDNYFAPEIKDGKPTETKIRYFNLAEEKQRLQTWLNSGGKDLVKQKWSNIRNFNEDSKNGPKAFGHLVWHVRAIRPSTRMSAEGTKFWNGSWSQGGGKLAPAVVKLWDDAEYGGGQIPADFLAKKPHEQVLLELVAINYHDEHFSGDDLDPAGIRPDTARDGGAAVNYLLRPDRSQAYGEWSGRNLQKCSAIILNGEVKSAPYFESKITTSGQIHGDFTQAEVEELVKVLRTGSLKIEPELHSRQEIGPSLGADSIRAGSWSLAIGSVAVFLFMLWYYGQSGVIACVTLGLNVFLLWAAMLFMKATITLPGLGGIVLTMGMAVDANILIYERIREEQAKGKDLLRAVRAGFERAMSAILDSNITTFLAGLVLYNVGVGPVRGFAVTLMLGIVTTLFTQFFVTRLCFHFALEKNWMKEFRAKSLIKELNVDFVRYIKTCMTISAVVILGGLVYALTVVPKEVLLGMDFTGGANLAVALKEPTTVDEVEKALESDAEFNKQYPNVGVNTIEPGPDGKARQFNLRFKLTEVQRTEVEAARAAWRQQKAAAEKAGEQPPQIYEPPYVGHLRRLFSDRLVPPASSGATVRPGPQTGFAELTIHFQEEVDTQRIRDLLTQARIPQVQADPAPDKTAAKSRAFFIQWDTKADTPSWQLFGTVSSALRGLKTSDATDAKEVPLSEPFPQAEEIQGRIVGQLRNAAIGALILSWILIIGYLRVRFHEYSFGFAAVVALVHDVLVTFVAVAIANHLGLVHAEINLAMIACFLAIIGYSVNDTIVIFDRIRENIQDQQRLGGDRTFAQLINLSLNQTLARTLLTSFVTLFVVIAQFVVNWGSDSDLESFAFAMIIGMASGVYSTIYIAAPILIMLRKNQPMPVVPPPPSAVEVTAH
ncbi:MAG: protein translocase subunit SecD [Planctomycetes bacterium]|nr:protein translocase subunit SecD [Planctomycetota bacterium]